MWVLTVGGDPNNTQYFAGIAGNVYPAVMGADWGRAGEAVKAIAATVTVPKAGMRAAPPTVSGTGWAISGTGYTEYADTISYSFAWRGQTSDTSYAQFPLEFTLPGVGAGTLPAQVLPKQATLLFVSAQVNGSATGATTVTT